MKLLDWIADHPILTIILILVLLAGEEDIISSTHTSNKFKMDVSSSPQGKTYTFTCEEPPCFLTKKDWERLEKEIDDKGDFIGIK